MRIPTISSFDFHAVRKIALVTFSLVGALVPAFGEVQQQGLIVALKGKEVIATIELGDTGLTQGSSEEFSVTTLVYLDGQVVYRIDAGFIHMDVVQMRKRFNVGSIFQVNGLDFKGDRLDVKLLSRDRHNTTLKIMFGAGWQSKLSNSEALGAVSKFLLTNKTEAEAGMPTERLAPPNNSAPPTVVTAARYTRSTSAPIVPGRLPETKVQLVLNGLARDRQVLLSSLSDDATALAYGLRGFQAAYASDHTARMRSIVQTIVQLQVKLGTQLLPRTLDEFEELSALYGQCAELARFRQAIDVTPAGAAANTLGYQQIASHHGASIFEKSKRDLEDAKVKNSVIEEAENAVKAIERAFDQNDFDAAHRNLQLLASDSTLLQLSAMQNYSRQYANVFDDLTLYLQIKQEKRGVNVISVEQIAAISKELATLDTAAAKPLSADLLSRNILRDKQILNSKIAALPTFQFNRKEYEVPGYSSAHITAQQTELLEDRVKKLGTILAENSDVLAVLQNADSMNQLKLLLSDEAEAKLKTKSVALLEAQLLAGQMASRLLKESIRMEAEAGRKIAEAAVVEHAAQKQHDDTIKVEFAWDGVQRGVERIEYARMVEQVLRKEDIGRGIDPTLVYEHAVAKSPDYGLPFKVRDFSLLEITSNAMALPGDVYGLLKAALLNRGAYAVGFRALHLQNRDHTLLCIIRLRIDGAKPAACFRQGFNQGYLTTQDTIHVWPEGFTVK